jgi:hypothetical protein
MANMTPTNLLQGIAKVAKRFNEPEFRLPNSAAVSTARLGDVLDSPMSELRTREDRATYMDWIVSKADEGATERLYNHSAGRIDSNRSQITWGSVVDGFSISMKQLDNNNFSFDEVFAKGILNSIRNNLSKFDTAFLTLLLADKTGVNLADFGDRGSFNAADDIFEIAADQTPYWLQMVEATLGSNNYNNDLIVIADSIAHIDMMRAYNQGAANSVNTAWQYGRTNVVHSNRQIFTGYNGSAIAMPSGMAGLFTWIPKQNRKALDVEKAMTTVNGDLGSIQVPIMDSMGNVVYTIDAALSVYTKRADTSQSNGSKQDLLTEVELSWDYAYNSAPLSTANESVVYGFGMNKVVVQ